MTCQEDGNSAFSFPVSFRKTLEEFESETAATREEFNRWLERGDWQHERARDARMERT